MSGASWLRRFGRAADRALLNACYPEKAVCLVCGRAAGGEPLCRRCALMMDHDRLQMTDPDCRIVWRYEGPAGALVRLLKERGVAAAAEALSDGMAGALAEMDPPPDTVVTWVPMPVRRRRERGIDHGEVLARAAAARAGLRVMPLLRRSVADMRTQRGLNREERLRNVRGCFEAVGETPLNCLIADDVMTSGATLQECRETLLCSGAQRVMLLSACSPDTELGIGPRLTTEGTHANGNTDPAPDGADAAADGCVRGGGAGGEHQ